MACRHGDFSLIPRSHVKKKSDMTSYVYNTGEVEEIEREADLWGSVTRQHTLPSDLQASESQHLVNKIELETSLSG